MNDKILLLWLLQLISACTYYSAPNLYIPLRRIFFQLCVFVWCGFVCLCLSTTLSIAKAMLPNRELFQTRTAQKTRTVLKKRELFHQTKNCFSKTEIGFKKNENCLQITRTVSWKLVPSYKTRTVTRKQELLQKPKTA